MAYQLDTAEIALPKGAWARTHPRRLRNDGRSVLGLTRGDYRPFIHPLYTPAGYPVTSEAPADHPHHQSVWIGADHVHAIVPASEGTSEEYTYNFYVNDVFQGRAPGRIVEESLSGSDIAGGFRLAQCLTWRGPVEWAAPEGRIILREERVIRVKQTSDATVLHIRSALTPGEWSIRLGPTRHAYFNVRVIDSLNQLAGGRVLDQTGRPLPPTQTPTAQWIDYVGPVGGGHEAGVALIPLADDGDGWWFVSDWGVITWGPFRRRACELHAGDERVLEACIVAHDGDVGPTRLQALRDDILRGAST